MEIFQAVRSAVTDWLESKADAGKDVDKNWTAKLSFVATDLLRFANVNMRISQCLQVQSMARANKRVARCTSGEPSTLSR